MRKNGQGLTLETTLKLVFIAVVLVVVVPGIISLFGKPISTAKFIPGFNNTESTEGMSIVGINLAEGNRLEYRGEKWKVVDLKSDGFVLGNYELRPENFKQELVGFYFNTPRKPERLSIEVNAWRYWDVTKGVRELVTIFPYTKKTLVETEKIDSKDGYIEVDYSGKPIVKDERGFPFFTGAELQSGSVNGHLKLAVDWIDSILQGGKCEKFIALNVKENKEDKNNTYTVRRLDNYLFVDLSKPVSGGTSQQWDREKCFGVDNFEEYKDIVAVGSLVEFKYTNSNFFTSSPNVLRWTEDGRWSPFSDHKIDSRTFYLFLTSLVESGLLNNAEFDSSRGEGVFVAGSKVNLEFMNGKKFSNLTPLEKNKFVYEVLTEYYKHYFFRGEGF